MIKTKMDKYKIDWKDVVHGSFEIRASSSSEALEKFKSLCRQELYAKSKWGSDGMGLKVKFIENKDSPFDAYTISEMKNYGKKQIEDWDIIWKHLP